MEFPRLGQLEAQRTVIESEIGDLRQFTALLYEHGDLLVDAVISALRFFGLRAERTEKGATVDVLAETADGMRKFGIEVTGVSGTIKKDGNKLTQIWSAG